MPGGPAHAGRAYFVEKPLRSRSVGAEQEFCSAGGRICLLNRALCPLAKTCVLKIQANLSPPEFFNTIGPKPTFVETESFAAQSAMSRHWRPKRSPTNEWALDHNMLGGSFVYSNGLAAASRANSNTMQSSSSSTPPASNCIPWIVYP